MKESNYWKGFLMGMVAVLALGGGIYYGLGFHDSILSDISFLFKIQYLEKLIETYYLEEAEETLLEEGIYTGMLNSLGDPYSRYYTAQQYEAELSSTEGHYIGIGIVMQKNPDGGVLIVTCYEGSSAEEEGLKAGDVITKVGETELGDLGLDEVSALIHAREDNLVELTIFREELEEELSVTVALRDIELKSVFPEMLEDNIGYIQISEFSGVTEKQYQAAFEELKEQGMEKLIVDLRNNPGGMLYTVCDILDAMLPEGILVYTEDKYGNREEIRSDAEQPLAIPLVVLVNENSASASEIFAGAIQDYEAGIIVGTQTYGKGIVQTVRSLSDGSAVKLTISKYYTPKGKDIHHVGITPDHEVYLDSEALYLQEISPEEDCQLQKAKEILEKMYGI